MKKIKDFLIKILGGYRIITVVYDYNTGSIQSRKIINLYPFGNHCLNINSGDTLYFSKDGNIEVKRTKTI